MEIRMERKNAPVVNGLDSVLAEIQQRMQAQPNEWLKSLQSKPGDFRDLEKEIHRVFGQMADRVVAGLLAQTTKPAEFADTAKKK
jgi:hypothetical protein